MSINCHAFRCVSLRLFTCHLQMTSCCSTTIWCNLYYSTQHGNGKHYFIHIIKASLVRKIRSCYWSLLFSMHCYFSNIGISFQKLLFYFMYVIKIQLGVAIWCQGVCHPGLGGEGSSGGVIHSQCGRVAAGNYWLPVCYSRWHRPRLDTNEAEW